MNPRPFTTSVRRRSAALLLCFAAAGCATAHVKDEKIVQWPFPPNTPRIRFVRSFKYPQEMRNESAFWAALRSLLPGTSADFIRQPTGLALSPDDRWLYVACPAVKKVVKVDLQEGKITRTANPRGVELTNPYGAAVDSDGNLYVSDKLKNEVFVFSKDGALLRSFGKDRLQSPMALALDRRGQVLYVVNGAATKATEHRVEAYSLRGDHIRTIGKRGDGPGEFNFPTALAVAPDGRLFVTDMLNFRIQVFSADGEFQTYFGKIGIGAPGAFDKAKGLAFDAFGNLYVVDGGQATVQIFNSDYQPLLVFSGSGDNIMGLMGVPNAIAISSKNEIYVADFIDRVHEFRLINTTAADSKPKDEAPPRAPTSSSKAAPAAPGTAAPGTAAPGTAAPGTAAPAPATPAAPRKP